MHKDNDAKTFKMLIEGYGLAEVMRTPGVDYKKTRTNHILEMSKVLGIEAARQCIIEEIKFVLGSYGINIDARHM